MNLTAFQNLPQATVSWIIAGVIGFLVALFLVWRYQVHSKLFKRYSDCRSALYSAVTRTETTYKQLTGDPAGLALQAPNFSGQTKTEYDRVRLTWLNWINLRAFGDERLSRADALYKKHKLRPWWQCFFCRDLNGAVAVLVSEPLSGTCQALNGMAAVITLASANGTSQSLAGAIANQQVAIASSFQVFSKTLADAAQTRQEFELEFTNTAKDERVGIDCLRSNLLKVGLALSPYEERLAELTRLKEELFHQLAYDPIAATGQTSVALKQRIGMVRRTLLDAIEHKTALEALRARHQKVAEGAAALQRRKPKSAIEVVRFSVKYSLNEPKFELPPLIAESGQYLLELDTLLLDGHLVRFGRAIEPVEKNVGRAEKLLVRIGEDKQRADEGFARLIELSSTADVLHDESEHRNIQELYGAQKWNAAADAVESLLETCKKRAQVRQSHAGLQGSLGELAARIRDLARVVSQGLDDRLSELEGEADEIGRCAALPNSDCAKLEIQIAALTAQLTGTSADSLQARLEVELAVHAQAKDGLKQLVSLMTDVTTRVADNWGGNAAAQQLAGVQPLLAPIVADGKKAKLDWSLLLTRITELLAQVEPIRVLVYAEVARHERLTTAIADALHFVQSLAGQPYMRTTGGVTYGAGIFCPNVGLSELVGKAEQEIGRRSYDEVAQILKALQEKVGRDHLECCWLVLQTMAHTSESCAVRFAHENGYCDGMFETWVAERLKLDEEGFHLFQLPELTAEAAARGKTPLLLRTPTFDEPAASDYEPAYVA